MGSFAYTSYKHQRDQELLDRLNQAIFMLKLEAQQVPTHRQRPGGVRATREDLVRFLDDLEARVRLLIGEPTSTEASLAFTGLADRFVRENVADVPDRLDQLQRVRDHLSGSQPLRERDFDKLDHLQSLLEEEAAEGVRGLFSY